jgi:hypothetical protein
VVWVAFCSSSYSNGIVSGTTNNAAANGLNWSMSGVLPGETGLIVNGMIYRYTTEKVTEDDMKVHIRNEDTLSNEYIFSNTDDWSGGPGGTINKVVPVDRISGTRFGDGEIAIEGDGNVKNPIVTYSYQFDPCAVVLSDPSCPGYAEALAALLAEQALLNPTEMEIENPYDNKEIQNVLDNEVEIEEEFETTENAESKEENSLDTNSAMLDKYAGQLDLMEAYSVQEQGLNQYYIVNIPGGIYEETIKLEPNQLADNNRALRNFASDTLHRRIVRSQYE